MAKVRVYELARELGQESKQVLERARELGVEVKTASSGVEEDIAAQIRESFGGGTAQEADSSQLTADSDKEKEADSSQLTADSCEEDIDAG